MIWDHHEAFHKTKWLPMQPAWKNMNANQQIKTVYTSKITEFYRNFLIEYSSIDILKPRFT